MTREITVLHWCDAHGAKGEHEPATVTHEVTWDGLARVLDLCDACDAHLAQPLAAILREISASPDASPAPPPRSGRVSPAGLWACVLCEYVPGGLRRVESMSAHYRTVHGAKLSAVAPERCPVCGADAAGAARGVAMHISAQHRDVGVTGLMDGLGWAARHGDPHGVVADVRARYAALDAT